MAVIVGKIVSGTVKNKPEPAGTQVVQKSEREIEYLTAPVPVRRNKLGFGAVIVIQLLLAAALGAFLWIASGRGGELGVFAEELLRRLLNG